MDEFQISSRELEAELETQLEQLEVQTRELQSTLIKFEQENELLKVCVHCQSMHMCHVFIVSLCVCDMCSLTEHAHVTCVHCQRVHM